MIKQVLIAIILFALLVIVGLIFFRRPAMPKMTQLEVGGKTFNVEIADTIALRTQGLSGRSGLEGDAGMLFIFSAPGRYDFWMKGMQFPIDIIWINGDKVVGFAENADPVGGAKNVYSPPGEADKVLEINAGLVKSLGIQIGDEVKIKQ